MNSDFRLKMQSIVILIAVFLVGTVLPISNWRDYESNIKFQIFKDVDNPFYSNLGDNLVEQGCPSDKNCEFCRIFHKIIFVE